MSSFSIIKELLALNEDGATVTGMYAPTNGLLKRETPPEESRVQVSDPPTPEVSNPRLFGKVIRRKLSTRQIARLFTILRSQGKV